MRDLQIYSSRVDNMIAREVEVSSGQSQYARTLVEIWKDATSAYLNLRLRNRGASHNAEKVMKEAMKFEITEVVFFLGMRLMKYFPYRGKRELTKRYQAIVQEYQKKLNAETDVEFMLCDIDQDIIRKLSNDKVMQKLEVYIKEVDAILDQFDSLNFLMNAYTLKLRKAQLENNKDEIILLCNEAMTRLNHKKYELPHIVYLLFIHPVIPILIVTGRYTAASQKIQSLYDRLKQGTVNWFIPHSYDVFLNFRKLDFEKVGMLLDQVKKFDNEVTRERYQIYDAYLSLFTKRSFKLGKFTNEVFEYSKDRQGHRVNIVIVQMLHLLKYNRIGLYIDRVEAIEKYLQRYLKSTSSRLLRSRYFLKSLLLLPKCNFNKIAFERKTKKLYQQLLVTPKAQTKQQFEQEPIPYEYLYDFVKTLLK